MRIILGMLIMLIMVATFSCARNGYGCKGNSKIMTRVQ
jgi:hypothetical protein